jgi:hypothetical protein
VLSIMKEEWIQLIRAVVVPCFKGSWDLHRLTHPSGADDSLESVTGDNCWLQWPCTVRDSTQSKRKRDIRSGCVRPAPRSRMLESFVEAAELAAPAARPAARRPSYSENSGGYGYLEFDVWGVLALEESTNGKWEAPKTRQVWCHASTWLAPRAHRPPAPPVLRLCASECLGAPWCCIAVVQRERRWRVHVGLHVLIAYMKSGLTSELWCR